MPTPPWDVLWINLSAATMEQATGLPYGAIEDAAIGVQGGRIVYVGRRSDLPDSAKSLAKQVLDGQGGWMTPGLIDCHTHLIYEGNRAREFEMRLQGATYEEIARAGGGIVSTVQSTRKANEDQLVATALPRLDALHGEGVTTIEIKSGYGLEVETELRMLSAARRLGQERRGTVCTTFLGAHATPVEYAGRADAYIDMVCKEMLPAAAAAGLVDAVDAFCEGIGFSLDQTRRVFTAARSLRLPVKLHAEQLSLLGGAQLVAEFAGLSADHLEYLDTAGVAAMAKSGVVAVLLPGAFYMLRETQLPPIAALREAAVPIALATDCNPGTSPTTSLLLMLNMGCTLFRLTPEEALAGVTCHGARALGLMDRGLLQVGLRADMTLWDIGHPAELAYTIGFNPCRAVMVEGHLRFRPLAQLVS